MRKVVLLAFVFLFNYVYAQYPVTQNLGSNKTLITTNGGGINGGIIPLSFVDTSTANLSPISYYNGAIISIGGEIWTRYNSKWNKIGLSDTVFAKYPVRIDTTGVRDTIYLAQEFIDSVYNNSPGFSDGLVSVGGIVLADTTIVVIAPIVWKRNGVAYTQSTNSQFPIPRADSAYYRTDIIYITSADTLARLQGTQDTITSVPPPTPFGGILITYANVYGTSVTNNGVVNNYQRTGVVFVDANTGNLRTDSTAFSWSQAYDALVIGTSAANLNPSAILQLNSQKAGFLMPTMSSNNRTNISSPANGLMVYDTDSSALFYYDNTQWKKILNSTAIPTLQQVTTTGDTTDQYVKFKFNGIRRVSINPKDSWPLRITNSNGYDSTIIDAGDIVTYKFSGYANNISRLLLNPNTFTPSLSTVILPITEFGNANNYTRTLAISVNNQYADSMGNITITPSVSSLQQVLDYDHNLTDGINLQGTGSGTGNTGLDINSFGSAALENNTGNNVNACGNSSGRNNTGNDVNGMGRGSANGNNGFNVNAFGYEAGISNAYGNVNLFGKNASATDSNQTSLAGSTYQARIDYNRLTTDQKYDLPDSSGTIALTSNIPDTTNKWVTNVLAVSDSSFNVSRNGSNTLITIKGVTNARRLTTQVYNNSGTTITRGSVVYINGRHSSNLPTIALAQANDEANSYKTFALVEDDIATSNSGTIIQAGFIGNLNLPTSTYTDGDLLYLSPTVAGGYTTVKPTSPNHICKIGSVTRAHPTLGAIEIKIENGWELAEMSDVQIAAVPADSAVLQFSRVDSLWHDVSPDTVLGDRAWRTGGNGSVNSNYFIGSTNNASLRFRTNNTETMVLDSIGRLQLKSFSNNGTVTNALQLANTDNRSFFNVSTSQSITNLTIKANNNAIGDSLVIADTGLIQPRTNSGIWLNGRTTGVFNVMASRCNTCINTGSIFSANISGNAPIFNVLGTGQVSIGAANPDATAALDITSTSRGLLIPRMTTTQRNAISSPATGLMVWNTTDSIVNQYNGNRWQNVGITAMTQAAMDAMSNPALGTQIYNTTYDANCTFTQDFGWWSNDQNWLTSNGMMAMEDFLSYPIASTGNGFIFQNNLTGGAISAATPISNRPGILQLSTSTSATGRAAILSDGNAVSTLIVGGGKIIFESDVQIPTLSSSAQTFAFSTGFSGSGVTTANNAIYFLYDSAGATTGSAAIGRWQVVCSNGSTRTYTTTDSTVTAGRWYRLRFEVNAAGTSVAFYINGTLVKTETNNIPTGNLTPVATILKSNGTTARTALIDYIRIRQKFTTPR